MSAAGERGFTLIEALVVMGVAALIAGIGFPAVDRAIDRARFAADANAVALAIKEARGEALRTDRRVALTPGRDGRGLWRDGAEMVRVAEGARVSVAPAALLFHADGTATAGVAVLAAGRRSRHFSIDPLTGGVEASR